MEGEGVLSCWRRWLDVAGDGRPKGNGLSGDLVEVVVRFANPAVVYLHSCFSVMDGVGAVQSMGAVFWGTGFGDAVVGGDGAAAKAMLVAIAGDRITHCRRCCLLREGEV